MHLHWIQLRYAKERGGKAGRREGEGRISVQEHVREEARDRELQPESNENFL